MYELFEGLMFFLAEPAPRVVVGTLPAMLLQFNGFEFYWGSILRICS